MTTLQEAEEELIDAIDAFEKALDRFIGTGTNARKPLTDTEIFVLYESTSFDWVRGKTSKGIEVLFARAIERAHGIGSEE